MPLFTCPKCKRQTEAGSETAGKSIICTSCGSSFTALLPIRDLWPWLRTDKGLIIILWLVAFFVAVVNCRGIREPFDALKALVYIIAAFVVAISGTVITHYRNKPNGH